MASSISLLSDQGSTFSRGEICTILLNIYSANGTPVGVENNPIRDRGEYRPHTASEHYAIGGSSLYACVSIWHRDH